MKKKNKAKEVPRVEEDLLDLDDIEYSEDDDSIKLTKQPVQGKKQEEVECQKDIIPEENFNEELIMPHPMINYFNYITDLENRVKQLELSISNIIEHLNQETQEDKNIE